MHQLDTRRVRDPRFLLLYSPLQFAPGEVAKPDGSLSLAYIAGAIRRAGFEVKILDCSVGDEDDVLADTFYRSTPLASGLFRVGMSPGRIADVVSRYDVVGISSIFTPQTSMVLELVRIVKQVAPEKLVLAGGVNARNLRKRFYEAGVDVITTSEAESTIVEIAEALRGRRHLTDIAGIAFCDDAGAEVVNPAGAIPADLDLLPFPSWDLLPLEKYWDISRPHGGEFQIGERVRYASLQTSRGCPFRCEYCHISMETGGSVSGALGRYRMKSIGRVVRELEMLKGLGVEYIFLEDDSLFAKKPRALELFQLVRSMGLKLLDVNGINIVHLQKNFGGRLGPDVAFLEVLAEAGLRFLALPFESANQRIIDRYASSKWNTRATDVPTMLQALRDTGIDASGNYMIGYPDETEAEITNTILMAKGHVEAGINYALFFTVVPFPGSKVYETALANGQLDPDFDPDMMRWTKSILRNLCMPADSLERLRQLAWLTVNRSEYVNYKTKMRVEVLRAGEA